MADYQYIPVQKELIPYRFDITLAGRTFTFAVNYNAGYDFFTIDLYRNEELIVAGEKIVYGRIMFCYLRHLDVPQVIIIPYDLSLNTDRVTWDNFDETVFLWIPDRGITDV